MGVNEKENKDRFHHSLRGKQQPGSVVVFARFCFGYIVVIINKIYFLTFEIKTLILRNNKFMKAIKICFDVIKQKIKQKILTATITLNRLKAAHQSRAKVT